MLQIYLPQADVGTHLPTPEGWKAALACAEKKSHRHSNLGRADDRIRELVVER